MNVKCFILITMGLIYPKSTTFGSTKSCFIKAVNKIARVGYNSLGYTAHTLTVPVWGPIEIIRDVGEKWKDLGVISIIKVPAKFLASEKKYVAGVTVLYLLADGTVTQLPHLLDETKKIDYNKDGTAVFVNGFHKDSLRENATFRFIKKGVFFPEVKKRVTISNDVKYQGRTIPNALEENFEKNGTMSALLINAHSESGIMGCGNFSDFNKYSIRLMEKKWFDKKSIIVLAGCSVGSGKKGQEFMQMLADRTGATIVAPRHTLVVVAPIPQLLYEEIGMEPSPETKIQISKVIGQFMKPASVLFGGGISIYQGHEFTYGPVVVVKPTKKKGK